MEEPAPAPDAKIPLTTMHVRRAVEGDMRSLSCVVERLSPLLIATAEYRLGPALKRHVDAADLVNEAWVVALPKLAELEERNGRITPVLLKYLTTTINYRINRLLRKEIRGEHKTAPPSAEDVIDQLPTDASGVITRALRHELADIVRSTLAEMNPADREVILLRGIEQNPSKAVAVMLGITPQAVDQRYSRALKRLRTQLPESVFWELED